MHRQEALHQCNKMAPITRSDISEGTSLRELSCIQQSVGLFLSDEEELSTGSDTNPTKVSPTCRSSLPIVGWYRCPVSLNGGSKPKKPLEPADLQVKGSLDAPPVHILARVGQPSCKSRTTCEEGNWLDSTCNRDGKILSPEGPHRTCSHGGEQREFGGVQLAKKSVWNELREASHVSSIHDSPTQKRIHGACSWHWFYLAP